MTNDGGRRAHLYPVHKETQYRHPSLVMTSDGGRFTIAAFSARFMSSLRGRIIRENVARFGCAALGKRCAAKKSTLPSKIWSFAEHFARQLQLVVPMTVDFYVLGVWT